jgi:NADH-quinone oxidoreductase subunit J
LFFTENRKLKTGLNMTLYAIIFYILAAIVLAATVLAVTSRNVMHAIIYVVVSFFAMAPIFYLLGAPLLALLEIIIYAGAIMVLFLFVVMMLKIEPTTAGAPWLRQWAPALVLSAVTGAIMIFLLRQDPAIQARLQPAMALPKDFGYFIFDRYWLPVEIASLLLFVALVGAYYLGRRRPETGEEP